jgi:hypothetical protein
MALEISSWTFAVNYLRFSAISSAGVESSVENILGQITGLPTLKRKIKAIRNDLGTSLNHRGCHFAGLSAS